MPSRSQEGNIEAPSPSRRLAAWRRTARVTGRTLVVKGLWTGLLASGLLASGLLAPGALAQDGAAPAVAPAAISQVADRPSEAAEATTETVAEAMDDGRMVTTSSPDDALWAEESVEVDLLPLIAKVTIGLGLVVGLAWGSVWVLRRTTLGQGAVGGGNTVRVVERTWLGPKKAIFLVDIAGRTLALGVTEEHINVLSSWEEGQIDVSAPEPVSAGAFAVQLKSLLKRDEAVGAEARA